MATIHRTTMVPTKLELLAGWLPEQPWYGSTGALPALSRAGGFRLDDPAGEVGIEFAFVTDGQGTTYSVPMAYRGAPLPGAEHGLIGTSEHGVLGTRWVYDAAHDPVAIAQLLDFICGRADAQQQSESDTPDPSVGRHWPSAGRLAAATPLRVRNSEPGRTTVAVELTDGSTARTLSGSLHLVRGLERVTGDDLDLGRVEADWTRLDGTTARGPIAVVR
ncbi:1,4-alpha-glucan branching protein [Blastococcus sp. CT_GayMR16]|uniref:maltokinase N-terminal cap-like domain-containing protein n=1 Tax=Blastococcus sp. CT_GayMR16 TaxID=2559607 RepID=UPI001073FF67|nr:1,4-alpha-glucan branching protein [Blastococcus sp. CT_GayMR16]TFV88554.1 1,4-alpha-glucan branching protein [Blastococcus sp. CT_GayMR16]